jgi:tetratricopeptide (TPR) repeat protein
MSPCSSASFVFGEGARGVRDLQEPQVRHQLSTSARDRWLSDLYSLSLHLLLRGVWRYNPLVLRLVDGESLDSEAEAVAESVRAGKAIAVQVGPSMDQPRLVAAIVRRLDRPLVATVPAALDQVTETVLQLASGLEANAQRAVDGALRDAQRAPDQFIVVLDRLRDAAAGRPIVVDRSDQLSVVDRDNLPGALAPQVQQLARWIAEHAMVVTSPSPKRNPRWNTRIVRPAATPTVRLANGEQRATSLPWNEGNNPRLYRLALTLEALEGGARAPRYDDVSLDEYSEDALRGALWLALPEGVRALLEALAVHARPLPRLLCERIEGFGQESFEHGASLGLWTERGGQVVADDGWFSGLGYTVPRRAREEAQRRLAKGLQSVADLDEESAPLVGLALHGAQRHLLNLDQIDQALRYAKYGLELFVERARNQSENGDYESAAALYELLLSRSDLSPRLRAYVRHYLHYNRAHVRPAREGFAQTADGYERAAGEWPENALFWSRTIRAWVLADDLGRARSCLDRAIRAVRPHPQRDALLFARAARRLVELQRPFEAMELLGDYAPAPDEAARAHEEFAALCDALERGWRTTVIGLGGERSIVLHREVLCQMLRSDDGWRFCVDELASSRWHKRPSDSIGEVVSLVREEARSLCARPERELAPAERDRRTVLLSVVDLRASNLDASVRVRWVIGTLRREGEALLLVARESAARFEVQPELSKTLLVDDDLVLARVEARTTDSPDRGMVVGVRRCVRVNEAGGIELDLRPAEDATHVTSWMAPPRTVGPSPSDFSTMEPVGDPRQDR